MPCSPLRGKGRPRRRGATSVLVVLMTTVLLGVSALAIDFARLYTAINELQTAADAAALHGALLIQKAPNDLTIGNQVNTFATTYNRALGGPVENVTVTPYHYEVSVAKRKATAWGGADLNAVQVTVSRTRGLLLLGQLVGGSIPAPVRSATAWVATFTDNSCVRPWAIESGQLIKRAQGLSTSTIPKQALSPDDIAKLRALGRAMFVLAPPGSVAPSRTLYGDNLGGAWAALAPKTGNYNSSWNSCNSANPLLAGDRRPAAPSSPNPINATSQRIEPTGSSSSADDVCSEIIGSECWKDGSLGGPVVMAFGYTTGADDFAAFDKEHLIDFVGSFVVVCYKKTAGNNGCAPPAPLSTGVPNWRDVPVGTMAGYVDFTPPSFKGKFSLGNGSGSNRTTQQRLILVDPTR